MSGSTRRFAAAAALALTAAVFPMAAPAHAATEPSCVETLVANGVTEPAAVEACAAAAAGDPQKCLEAILKAITGVFQGQQPDMQALQSACNLAGSGGGAS
ncbi:hypothetical protein [Actinokineospora iranica]|uniref:Uncharacterized protein n=1 Tax=Actinokineospora iranica TaxID=1271860 RepID=A0A1G6KIX5_9PSEU|nr:hypothetical protein [Actinokineospora iranica]SDC31062.1 hypothetical protein SAMN05216174_101944 [Actinokineospora iranica]